MDIRLQITEQLKGLNELTPDFWDEVSEDEVKHLAKVTDAFTKFLKTKIRSALRYTGEDSNGKNPGAKIVKMPKKCGGLL